MKPVFDDATNPSLLNQNNNNFEIDSFGKRLSVIDTGGAKVIRVLVVEDNEGDFVLMREMLSDAVKESMVVEETILLERVVTLTEALIAIEQKDFNIVLLDLSLPDAEGFDAFHRIQIALPDIPIVLLTGFDDVTFAKDALSLGAQDFLMKGEVDGIDIARALFFAIERARFIERSMAQVPKNTELKKPLPVVGGSPLVNISNFIEDTVPLFQASFQHVLTIQLELFPKLPLVEVDLGKLRQVIVNLITNAVEAIGTNTGSLVLRTGVMKAGRKYLRDAFGDGYLNEGFYVYVEVLDSKEGISPAFKKRIFEPFFATKVHGGSLGLASVLGVVRSCGGAVKLENKNKRGTAFRVLFPCASS